MAQALTDVEKMAELLRVPIEVRDRAGAADLRQRVAHVPAARRDVAFERVSFRYSVGGPGVSELSLRIQPSGAVALVGPSGSGKSTSTRLLCRLLDVQRGAVRVCGFDVRDVTQHSLRSLVSTVSQASLAT